MTRQRDEMADSLKGYACLLVVFGHVIMGIRKAGGVGFPSWALLLERFIWTYHVSLFMFLSGYVYRLNGGWRSKQSRSRFILHKLLNLGVPYFAFATIYICINSFAPGVNTKFALSDILTLWKSAPAQYWFIYALFVLFTLYTVLSGSMRDGEIMLALLLAQYVAPAFGVTFGSFSSGISMSLAFGLGAISPYLWVDRQKAPVKLAIIAFHIACAGILTYAGFNELFMIDKVEQVLGIAASVALISLLTGYQPVKRFLLFICRASFPIYLMHTIFTAGVRIALNRVGMRIWGVHVLAGMIFGMAGPFAFAWISKFTPVEFLIYPSKALKRRRLKGKRCP